MHAISIEEIRNFRLRSHHLDRWYDRTEVEAVVGGCGMQNSPPGVWEAALANRIAACDGQWIERLLTEERTLLQAWSIRGVPLVFPVSGSHLFLSSLVAEEGERWIYTRGASWALEELGMGIEEALSLVERVMPNLDGETIVGKAALDRRIAGWVEGLLSPTLQAIWQQKSIYDPRGNQSLGEALVSFLLRPLSSKGLVVFAQRHGQEPSFTSYRTWVGKGIELVPPPQTTLVETFLHSYGPATVRHFASWLGCSPQQASRLWNEGHDRMEAVTVSTQRRYMLTQDVPALLTPRPLGRSIHLLAAHDPYLGLQDRAVICPHTEHQRIIWQTVANPGAIVHEGEIVGYWKSRKRAHVLDMELVVWEGAQLKGDALIPLAHHHAHVRGCTLGRLAIT